MSVQLVDISRIDASGRLRPINPDWAATLAETLGAGERLPPIEVVERGSGFRLIAGGHRLDAHRLIGRDTIEAEVYSADAFADEAAIRLREIKENMLRFELTALDRAVHLATWKEIHEAVAETPKRGRKPQTLDRQKLRQDSAAIMRGQTQAIDRDELAQDSAAFAQSFSRSAAAALRMSERSIRVAVQVAAGIGPDIRERIARAPIADNISELLQLAHQEPERQRGIVALLLSEPPQATGVAEAIAVLDRMPAPARPSGWERVSSRFSRLPADEQARFFEAHADAINRWLMAKGRRSA